MYDDANTELTPPARAKYARDHVKQYKRLVLNAPKWMTESKPSKAKARQTPRGKRK